MQFVNLTDTNTVLARQVQTLSVRMKNVESAQIALIRAFKKAGILSVEELKEIHDAVKTERGR